MSLSGDRRQRLCLSRVSGAAAVARGARPSPVPGGWARALPALLSGTVALTALPLGAAAGDPSTDDLNKLRADIQKEIAALKKQETKLHQQFMDLDRRSKVLDQKSVLLDEQIRNLRATGIGAASVVPAGVGAPVRRRRSPLRRRSVRRRPPQRSGIEVAQAPARRRAPPAPRRRGGEPEGPSPGGR